MNMWSKRRVKMKEVILPVWDEMVKVLHDPAIPRKERIDRYTKALWRWRELFPLPSKIVDPITASKGM